jgi:DNA adenine methylase Dam
MINTPLNYTGSKFKLLDELIPLLDTNKNNFIDLFVGGGSVFVNVLNLYNKIIINDVISELVEIHKNFIYDIDNFTNNVKELCVSKDDKDGFLSLRKSFNSEKTPEKLMSLMLCCTNNMMRFNKKFEFNQTFGKRTFNIKTQEKIDNLKKLYQNIDKNKIQFQSKNFYDVKIPNNSMVYIDPPYTNSEAGYNCYWSKELESKLYDYIIDIDKKDNSFALSGLYGEHKNGEKSKIIYDLLDKGFNYRILNKNYEKVAKNKNSKNSKEILIFNYEK